MRLPRTDTLYGMRDNKTTHFSYELDSFMFYSLVLTLRTTDLQ